MTRSKACKDISSHEVLFKVPSGRGDRYTVCHLGKAKTGLLVGFSLMWHGNKANKETDYHTETNIEVFKVWLVKTVFPKMQEVGKKCVLVLDRATTIPSFLNFRSFSLRVTTNRVRYVTR